METENYYAFVDATDEAIKKGDRPASFVPRSSDSLPFVDRKAASEGLRAELLKTVEHLDVEMSRFENHFSTKYNSIYWCPTYEEVFEGLRRIIKSEKAKSARLPKIEGSYIFREVGMKYFLRDEHITLREDGDLQFFNVDLLLADTGSMLLLNQSNRSFELLSNSHTNIFLASIDRLLCDSRWVEVYQQLLYYKYGSENQGFALTHGSEGCHNYLFVIDNRRSVVLHSPVLRPMLACLHCGRCNDVCPVFQTVGEEPYNNVFTGPVANVLLPYLESEESEQHIPFACTLCGRCEEACPLDLPLRDMIVSSRQHLFSAGTLDKKERHSLTTLRSFLSSRKRMNQSPFFKKIRFGKHASNDLKHSRRVPKWDSAPFAKRNTKNNTSHE